LKNKEITCKPINIQLPYRPGAVHAYRGKAKLCCCQMKAGNTSGLTQQAEDLNPWFVWKAKKQIWQLLTGRIENVQTDQK